MAQRGQRALRAPYGTDDNDYNNFRGSPRQLDLLTHREAFRNPSRLDILEERLAQQERNTQALIDRAFKIKEDVIDSLNFTHGTWQEEKHSRTMLQEHIRTITAVMVDEQLRSRDSATVGTNQAVKNLEVHHVASLTDLRGRIVRCDTSIAKLSTDLRSAADSVRTIVQQIGDLQNKMTEKMHGLEARIVAVSNQQERGK
ncbi:hypothetical protein KUTeg_017488 [Tegillarca granosa]|uniref:Tektin n=1 Tax=Tegillarca granosa TaxID=220873 RepID=A0ABQ9EFE5_TEGGR|nr:hypothetical protein KUTeg_017488 [Tegillarca granosa]